MATRDQAASGPPAGAAPGVAASRPGGAAPQRGGGAGPLPARRVPPQPPSKAGGVEEGAQRPGETSGHHSRVETDLL